MHWKNGILLVVCKQAVYFSEKNLSAFVSETMSPVMHFSNKIYGTQQGFLNSGCDLPILHPIPTGC